MLEVLREVNQDSFVIMDELGSGTDPTEGMGIAIAKSNESIARQPEAEGKIRTSMMLGLVFIETAIIYALVVAILVIFVL